MLAATRVWTSVRLLQSRPYASNAFRSTISLQSRCNHAREFSTVLGSSTLSEHRRLRSSVSIQQPASLTRNVSWEYRSKAAFRRAMKGFNQPTDSSKFVSVEQVKTWAGDLSGVRPGANIEDVERSAIDHLFRGDDKANIRKATLTNGHHFTGLRPNETTIGSNVYNGDASFIDPITNRRIPKSPKTAATPRYDDLEAYKPIDFVKATAEVDSTPKYDDLDKYKPITDAEESEKPAEPKYDDLDKYEPVIDETPTKEKAVEYDDLDQYGPIKYNEPDGQRQPTKEEDSKKYKDLDKYSSADIDSPFTKRQLTAEEKSKVYQDLNQYKPVYWNEPDGLKEKSAEELSKNYDDLNKYEAVYWNEPDGLRERTAEEVSKDYKDVDSYGPVQWSEPDGLRRLTPEEESKKYDDLDDYTKPFEASKSVLRAHEKAQMDTTMRGKPLASKVDAPVEDFASKYDDLHLYGPVRWNEPDGLRKLTPEELSKNYDDLHLYGAVRWNEPDGLRRPTAEEKSKNYKDTHLYATRDLSPPITRVHPEEASKAYNDLPGYRHYANADDAIPRIHPEEASKQYTDLDAYASFENDAPQAKQAHAEVASKKYKDLHKYPSAGFEETIQAQHVHPEELTKVYTDLGSYRPTEFVSQDQAYPVHPEEASKVYQDLHKYTAVSHNEPNGNMSIPLDEVARGLREFDSKAGSQESPDTTSNAYCGTPNRSFPDSMETDVHLDDSGSAESIRAAVLRRAQQNSQPTRNQDFSSNNDTVAERTLTGNYARDFPEEFVASWSRNNSSSKSTLLPNTSEVKPSSEKQVPTTIEDNDELGSMDESFPVEGRKLQPALNRYSGKVYKDTYSHEPQGLQTSYSEECGSSTVPVWEKHYEPKSESPKTTEVPCSIFYKILAYDPVSKMMSVVQTTSNVDGNKGPMSLPSALIQLAEPAKFVPYLASLQKQGYEVVSGSRQMLVFRQVRSTSGESVDTGIGSFDEMVRRGGVFPTTNGETSSRRHTKKRGLGRKVLVGTAGVAGGAFVTATLVEYLSTKGTRPETKQTRQV
ncbi:conserved serine-threonine rich [Fusarium longipes]|uniref:Conserved serine-threonine rich n=1 Tax=Fusarium longipes TaxID=694270 RepID=A0A395SRN6_9HYPO|nr:conserved serine-threonine rich [Fusarium longipes]